jgi:hypothetical protein
MVFPCRELDRLPALAALAAAGALAPCGAAAAMAGSDHPKGEGSLVTKFLEQTAWDHH